MSSGIEEIIEEIEEYVDGCKPSAFSPSKIIVNRDELESLLEELRTKTPEEIKRYQKIISNKEAILADAQNKADAIIAQAQIQTNELVSESGKFRTFDGAANQRVLDNTQRHIVLTCFSTKLRDGLNAQPTVFGDDDRGRVGNDASDFFNDSSLILTIKTHGLAPLRGVPLRGHRFSNNRHTSESFG